LNLRDRVKRAVADAARISPVHGDDVVRFTISIGFLCAVDALLKEMCAEGLIRRGHFAPTFSQQAFDRSFRLGGLPKGRRGRLMSRDAEFDPLMWVFYEGLGPDLAEPWPEIGFDSPSPVTGRKCGE
jgi:hypothetical protein